MSAEQVGMLGIFAVLAGVIAAAVFLIRRPGMPYLALGALIVAGIGAAMLLLALEVLR